MVIKSSIRKFVNWALSDDMERGYADKTMSSPIGVPINGYNSSNRINRDDGLNITVYNATGGKVVQFNRYDVNRDKMVGGMYVVTDQDDLAQELALIITREQLGR